MIKRRRYSRVFYVLGHPYDSIEAATKFFNCSKKSINAYLSGEVDHPYRSYTKHVEVNGVLYKCHQDACDALDITPRNLRWYLAGDASTALKLKIEGTP